LRLPLIQLAAAATDPAGEIVAEFERKLAFVVASDLRVVNGIGRLQIAAEAARATIPESTASHLLAHS
jgi:hypothetical protein